MDMSGEPVNEAPPLIEVQRLCKTVRDATGELPILRDVSFALAQRQTAAIVGASGSGKSTLLSLIAGLDVPSSGTVRIAGQDLFAVVTEIARHPLAPEEALALVGLTARLDHFPAQLSGGEQQRVAIARAIAKRPAVLLCDEPTGALDSATGVRVLQALEQVNAEMGATTVIITHNADIARMASRVLWMQDGQIVREQRNATRQQAASLQW